MTQPAFVGSVRSGAGSDESLDLIVSESLTAAGHVSRHDMSDLTVVLFGDLVDRASLARRLGCAEDSLPRGAALASLLVGAHDLEWLPESSGDFALVAWNRRTGTLVLARNHAGTRPLFYGETPGALHFGSDISPVLTSMGQGSASPFLPAVAAYLVGNAAPPGTTLAAGVRSVPAGHLLSWHDGTARLVCHWDPSHLPHSPVRSLNDAAAELRTLIKVAVGESMPPGGAVGTHLTGGIDSAIVAADLLMACEATGRPTPLAFAWHPDSSRESDAIDVRLINAMGTHLSMSVQWSSADDSALWAALARNPLEQPATSTLLHEVEVQTSASARGVATLFSGWGGDEFVSYNGRHLRGRTLRARAGRLRRLIAPTDPQRNDTGQLRGYASAVVRRHSVPSTLDALPSLRTARATQLCYLGSGHLSERTDSWSSAGSAFGVQYMYPLLDRRLLEWAFALPDSMVGAGRHLMREALRDVIPNEVRLNTDKSDASRDTSRAVDAVRARGLELTLNPALAPLVDLSRFTTQLLSDKPVVQPGKFMAAARLLYQPEGTALRELVTLP